MLERLTRRRPENETHPHDWHFPAITSSKLRSSSSSDFPAVPSSHIFRDVSIPYSMKSASAELPSLGQYPAPGHVASNLLLIECFDKLRTDVEASPGPDGGSNVERAEGSEDSRWTSYLRIAIKRFELWISKIESIIRHSACFNRYGTGSHLYGAFTENYLPPLDVLLVWYCYLQDSASYEKLLVENGFTLLSDICFPWHILPTFIERDTLEYVLTPAAEKLWENFVSVPVSLADCVEIDFAGRSTAFTVPEDELLTVIIGQSKWFRLICEHKWLRSPALAGTLQRALSRYSNATTLGQYSPEESQNPTPVAGAGESRSIGQLDLDVVAQVVLSTHKAYHSTWTSFAQLYNLADEDHTHPPSYSTAVGKLTSSSDVQILTKDPPRPESCYCWICERVADEVDHSATTSSPKMSPLSQMSSLGGSDEKWSTISSSSSSADDAERKPGLSKKQIKTIKKEIALYRYIEAGREKAMKERKTLRRST